MVGLPSFRKTNSGVVVSWGNLSTLVLWTQWDLIVAMMARKPSTDGKALEVREEHCVYAAGITLDADPSRVADLVVGALEDEPAVHVVEDSEGRITDFWVDETGYSTEE